MPQSQYTILLNRPFDAPQAAVHLSGKSAANVHEAVSFMATPRARVDSDVMFFERLGMLSMALTDEEVQKMRNRVGVEAVTPVRRLSSDESLMKIHGRTHFDVPPAESMAPLPQPVPWNIALVRANQIWGKATGKGVKVAVMDSGIAKGHPDLPVAGGMCFAPGFAADDWEDTHGHGTHCAGIIGARNNHTGIIGVAPECDLYALRVHDGNGGNTDWIFAAMEWAAREKMQVVSLSQWDTSGVGVPDAPYWTDMQRGAEILAQAGCIVVGIAGNCGAQDNHWVSNPGRCPAIMATGSVDSNRSWADSSAYGPDHLPEEQAVEIAAPGVAVLSTLPGGGYGHYSGTSMACPHVSGAAALLCQIRSEWSVPQIRGHLKATADDAGPSGRDAKFGVGILNCEKAVIDAFA